ncbi:hypothetical protein WA158_002038 [Blastocystis sp. Blastoise]
MVLAELGAKLNQALSKLSSATIVDDNVVNDVIKDITNALLQSDVNFKTVVNIRNQIKARYELEGQAPGVNKRKLIQKCVYDELVDMLSPKGSKPFHPVKGKSNVIMFVGLQGSGKTTTIAKFASYYKRKGWKTCMVCADTFRAGAFDQLKQNAIRAKVPFYGSYTEADPVVIAQEGVQQFKHERMEIIIVDTSGRHKQEEGLFEEMRQVQAAVKPNNIVFVLDSTIGQMAYDQALAFKQSVNIGSVVITKLDGHAKGGGALSAVAATGAPIMFIGTGEMFDDLEPFNASSFVSRLLGMGDIRGLFEEMKDGGLMNMKEDTMKRLQKGEFTLRDFGEQLNTILNMGPMDRILSMIPGLPQGMIQKGQEKEGVNRMKRFMYVLNSMTNKELDGEVKLEDSRLIRACLGSGVHPTEGQMMMDFYKQMSKMINKMGNNPLLKDQNMMQQLQRNPQNVMAQLQKTMNPQMLQQMGGAKNLMNIMKNFDMSQLGNLPGLGKM